MANEIRNFRSGLAQNHRNKGAYKILIWEIIIWSAGCAIALGYHFGSDRVTCVSFFVLLCVLVVCVNLPDIQVIVFIFFGFGWASPFILLGAYLDRFFYVIALFAFLMSFLIHYWGMTFLPDLSRTDED